MDCAQWRDVEQPARLFEASVAAMAQDGTAEVAVTTAAASHDDGKRL